MATLEANLKLRDQFTDVLTKIDASLNKATQSMHSFKQQVTELEQVLQSASAAITQMNAALQSSIDQVWNIIQPMTDRLMALFGNFGDQISSLVAIKDFTSKLMEGVNEITQVFDKIGKAVHSDLFEALMSGFDRFDQLPAKLSELVKSSLENLKQAMTGTDLFQTIFGKIKTAVAQGVAGVTSKFMKITEVFNGKTITKQLESGKKLFFDFFEAIKRGTGEGGQKLSEAMGKISGVVKKAKPQLDLLSQAFQKIKEPISDVITTIKEQFAKLPELFDRLKGFLGFGEKAGGASSATGNRFLTEAFVEPINTFFDTINGFAKKAANLALVYGIILLIKEAAQALKEVSEKVPDDLGDLAKKFGIMALALAAMGGIVAAAGYLADKNPEKALAGLLVVAGLSVNLMIAAEAMKHVDEKVPSDFGRFAAKLGMMALALVGMGGLVAAAGLLASLNPAAAIAGLIVIAAISLELMLAAEAMKQVDEKVPDNIGSFSSKLANIGIAIGGFTGLAATIGAVMATGIGGALIIAGMIAIAGVAAELMLMAEAILQVDEKVPDDSGSVEEKINNLLAVIQFFTDSDLGSIGDALKNVISGINTAVVAEIVNQLVSVAENLKRIEEIELSESIGEKMQEILSVVETINGQKGFFQAIGDTFKSGFDKSMFENVSESVDTLTQIASDLSALSQIDLPIEAITEKVENLLKVCDLIVGEGETGFWSSLKAKFTSGFDSSTFGNVSESVEQLGQIASDLSMISQIPLPIDSITQKVEDLLKVCNLIIGEGETGFWSSLKNKFTSGFDTSTFQNVSESVDQLLQIAFHLAILAAVPLNTEAITKTVEDLLEICELIIGSEKEGKGFWSSLRDKFTSGFDTSTYSNVLDSVNYLLNIARKLSSLAELSFDKEQIETRVSDMLKIINLLGDGEDSFWAKLTKTFGTQFDATALNNVSDSVHHLIRIANALLLLSLIPLETEAAIQTIEDLGEVIEALNEFPDLIGLEGIESMVSTFNTLTEALQLFISTAEISLDGLAGVAAAFETNMATMQTSTETTMTAIQEAATIGMELFVTSIESGMTQAAAAVETGKAAITQGFTGLQAELHAAGQHAMSGLAMGIQAGAGTAIAAAQSVAARVATVVRQALDIRSPSRVMMEIGGFVSAGLANGIQAAQQLVENASEALALATIPDQAAIITENGVITSSVQVDDKDISRIKASTNQAVIVQHKQVVPQVTVNVENNGADTLNVDDLVERVEEVILEAMAADLS